MCVRVLCTTRFKQDIQVFADLYLDVADAYIELGGEQDEKALEILAKLLERKEFPLEVGFYVFIVSHKRIVMTQSPYSKYISNMLSVMID